MCIAFESSDFIFSNSTAVFSKGWTAPFAVESRTVRVGEHPRRVQQNEDYSGLMAIVTGCCVCAIQKPCSVRHHREHRLPSFIAWLFSFPRASIRSPVVCSSLMKSAVASHRPGPPQLPLRRCFTVGLLVTIMSLFLLATSVSSSVFSLWRLRSMGIDASVTGPV